MTREEELQVIAAQVRHDDIARLADALWHRVGKPHGPNTPAIIWHEAEKQYDRLRSL